MESYLLESYLPNPPCYFVHKDHTEDLGDEKDGKGRVRGLLSSHFLYCLEASLPYLDSMAWKCFSVAPAWVVKKPHQLDDPGPPSSEWKETVCPQLGRLCFTGLKEKKLTRLMFTCLLLLRKDS